MEKKILVVDDMVEIVDLVAGWLKIKCKNYQIFTAMNGIDAIHINEKEDPDLIILDLRMIPIDGIETLRRIRKTDTKVKVIILSGFISEEVRKNMSNLNVDKYLEKPFEFDNLIQTINDVLNIKN